MIDSGEFPSFAEASVQSEAKYEAIDKKKIFLFSCK